MLTRVICWAVLACVIVVNISAQTTEFNYQGSLKDGNAPANGNYDFEFLLFDALAGGGQVGGTIGRSIRFRNSVSPKGAVVSYTEADDIERDYKEAVETISDGYAGDIDYEKATQAAIQGMLSTLDPHSMYFPFSEFKKLKEDQDSRFYGIGVTIVPHRDGVYIQSAVEGTPAGKLGLRYGDRILEVDGRDAREWSSEQVQKVAVDVVEVTIKWNGPALKGR